MLRRDGRLECGGGYDADCIREQIRLRSVFPTEEKSEDCQRYDFSQTAAHVIMHHLHSGCANQMAYCYL